MKINVVIPNYNGARLIEKNLPKVAASLHHYADAVITIVDDGSVDDDYSELEKFVSDFKKHSMVHIKLLRHTPNQGFSSTVNQGAFDRESDFIVLLNSDVAPAPDFLKSSLKILQEDERVFGVGSMDKSIESGKAFLRGRGIGVFKKGFLVHKRGEIDKKNSLWISGGSSVIRTALFKKIGGFDEAFNPFYWEDIDLSYRALKSGYTLVFNKESVVEHFHEDGAIQKNFRKTTISQIAYRNQFMFVWKNITDGLYMFQHIIYLPIHLARALFRGDMAMIYGFVSALKMFSVIMSNKSKAKKYFRVADRAVLSEFQNEYEA